MPKKMKSKSMGNKKPKGKQPPLSGNILGSGLATNAVRKLRARDRRIKEF